MSTKTLARRRAKKRTRDRRRIQMALLGDQDNNLVASKDKDDDDVLADGHGEDEDDDNDVLAGGHGEVGD